MAFTLIQKRTQTPVTFTEQHLLEHIGDAINDEIVLQGEVYRISSFAPVPTDGGAAPVSDWISAELTVESAGQHVFLAPQAITDPESVFLTVNSVLYQYGETRDFHLQEGSLYWHGSFDLEPTDRLVIRFPQPVEAPQGEEAAQNTL